MREILFRGKRKDNGEWVEGAFCLKDCDSPFGEMVDRPSIIKYDDPNSGFWFRVDPDTMGQFTGLTDKNGKEIFEGDIVEAYYDINCSSKCEILFERGSFRLKRIGRFSPPTTYSINLPLWCEVIGNIHDNPELLRGNGDET